jgi:hypothetical protein
MRVTTWHKIVPQRVGFIEATGTSNKLVCRCNLLAVYIAAKLERQTDRQTGGDRATYCA